MKAKYIAILVLCLVSQIGTLANTKYDKIHDSSEHVKVCPLLDGKLLVVSSPKGEQKTIYSKVDENARLIDKESYLDNGYTAGADLVQTSSENETEYHLIYHNKQNLLDRKYEEGKEYITSFGDDGNKRNHQIKPSLYTKISAVSLANGKVLVAGINYRPGFGAETSIEVNLYDPLTGTYGNGKSLTAHGTFISCYEQRDNEPYCLYVSYDNIFLTKLSIVRVIVNDNSIELEEPQDVIKVFYTVFNFIKAVKFNDNEVLVLYQTGNGDSDIEYGNSGKDLYYYHLAIDPHEVNSVKPYVKALRYEYLYNNCIYREDVEEYNADLIPLSDKRVFAVCEHEKNKFIGFGIYSDRKAIERFNFNNFNAKEVRNPVFAKFDKNLALFFTHINTAGTPSTAYMLINYPDCEDYEKVTIPQHYTKLLEKEFNVVMLNSHPADRQNEKIKIRFVSTQGVTIENARTKEVIELNKDIDPTSLRLRITPNEVVGNYTIEFTATREDPVDGLILGRTCKVEIETPECLPQCYSCPKLGTYHHNLCLACRNSSYTPIVDPGMEVGGYAPLYNCTPCNESCSSCYGLFYETPYPPSTNCKVCEYDKNYFPYEDDMKTCISQETKKYWEGVYKRAIYLDKSAGEDKKLWIWRKCHENCAECEEGGDDNDNKCIYCNEGLHFFCNQTVGNGIPGSCHRDCVNNGFYEVIKEDRRKCCPCLPHCKICTNETKCIQCNKTFYRTPDAEHCDEDCGYCLAKDDSKWECVNCKDNKLYNLDGRCVKELPKFNYTYYVNQSVTALKTKFFHIIDDTCNLIDACKEGCKRCSERYTDKCTECEEDYYRKDPFGIVPKPSVFQCYTKDTCIGKKIYPHGGVWHGGVTVIEDGEKVCLNCKQRNESYRLPEEQYYCGEKIDRTYIDIEDYNKLSECYPRCKTCDNWGHPNRMSCLSCRDGAHYELWYYDTKKGIGNCYRKAHKCGIYPYYHDYDLAKLLGKDEDNCGEDCDVCLKNFACPAKFPFFVYETHECVEFCPVTDLFGEKCNMNHTAAGLNLLKNPFGLRNPYDFLNRTIYLKEFISSGLYEYLVQAYPEMKGIDINNFLGNGQIYNLPESQIIIGNNISIELTTFKLELGKLAELITGGGGGGDGPTTSGPSILDLSSCEAILKKKYGISEEEDLMIIKGDLLKQLSEEYLGTVVEYQIFSTSLGAFLPLSDCQEAGTSVSISNPFDYSFLTSQFQSKIESGITNGYDVFNVDSPFYNDVCTPFTNENGNDVLLDDRRKDYFNENINLCDTGCVFAGYNTTTNYYTCICNIKSPGDEATPYSGDYVTKEMPENFKDMISRRSNIEVFKCASQVFSANGQKKNFGSYILLVGFASFIGVAIFHFIKEKVEMDIIFKGLGIIQNQPANPPKPTGTKEEKTKKKSNSESSEKKDKKEKKEPKKKVNVDNKGKTSKNPMKKPIENPKNIHKEVVLRDDQLNFASYARALKYDNRTFLARYWSLLKMKQLCIFTFYTSEDYILRSTKIALFILFMCFYFAFTALFFNDDIMRNIYKYKGNSDAAVHIPNIVLSSICSIIMGIIVRFVSLNERDIVKITQEENPEQRKTLAEKARRTSKIKMILLYVIAGLLILLCWYYVAAFCAVFKNSQGHYFVNWLVAFIVCNIWPCVTSLISTSLRHKALQTGISETLYRISQIVSLI